MQTQTPVSNANANLVASSSTPIRISGTGSSFHQSAAAESPSQSSSVPATVAPVSHHPGHLQLQSSMSVNTSGTQMGSSSNQSLGGAGGGGGSSSTPPNSAGLRQSVENKLFRRTSLQIMLPKLPSTDSLSNSPGPSSPGIVNWATESRDKFDGNQTDKDNDINLELKVDPEPIAKVSSQSDTKQPKKHKSTGVVLKQRYSKAVFILEKIAENEAAGTADERDAVDKIKYQEMVDMYLNYKKDKATPSSENAKEQIEPKIDPEPVATVSSQSDTKQPKRHKSSGTVLKQRYSKAVFILEKIAKNEAAGTADERDAIDKRKYQEIVDMYLNRNEADATPSTSSSPSTPSSVHALGYWTQDEMPQTSNRYKLSGHPPKRHSNLGNEFSPPPKRPYNNSNDSRRDHLQMAIVDGFSGTFQPLLEVWPFVEARLSEMVFEYLMNSNNARIPYFDSSEIVRGYRVVKCKDFFSKSFLEMCVENICNAWPGIKLTLIPFEDIPKRPRARIWIPNMKIDSNTFLCCLKKQNPHIVMDNWAVIKFEEVQKNSLSILMAITHDSLPALEREGYKLSFGIRQAKVKVFRPMEDADMVDDGTPTDTSKLNRKESYKAQRKNYRREKKRVASELLNSLQDPAVIVLADWLKVRGTLKSWTKLWCVLKPGLLLIYKSPKTKSSHWVGTVLITSCQVIERPSKKDGFCFKLFHPLEQSIWAPRGPDKETIGAVVQPLPTAYLIFRAPSQAAGKCWMDALELSLRCSALILRSNSNSGALIGTETSIVDAEQISHETQWSEADYEKHFNEHDLDADSQNEAATAIMSGMDSDTESDVDPDIEPPEDAPETPYVPLMEEPFGDQVGEQIEELGEENKSLIWILLKQVRPGMDLSKVVLPTFILEPRSFLDKLSDSYYHADILSKAVLEDDPFTRMKLVVQWYLSGFYKKPKGLKKPYNPILGETFRCFWEHPNGSRTYYIAEQVSHHPPVSAFYVTNRQDGFCISCSILAKSKFYGNSTSAVLEGVATLTLLPRGESYTLTTPYAHCKGILMGTLSMELGGKINIECENTGYKTEIEFKLKPFLGGSDSTNVVSGKIKMGKDTMATISGHWDTEVRIKDAKAGAENNILLAVNNETKQKRLMRYVVPLEAQEPNESEHLWQLVSEAIQRDDQVGATAEKTVLEDAQRNGAKERKATFMEWEALHFQQDVLSGEWFYKYADLRPWDPRNDLKQYEANYKVLTKQRHQAPMVRTASIISVDPMRVLRNTSRRSSIVISAAKRKPSTKKPITLEVNDSDSSQSNDELIKKTLSSKSLRQLAAGIEQVNMALDNHTRQLMLIQAKLERMQYEPTTLSSTTFRTVNSVSTLLIGFLPRSIPQSTVIKCVIYAFAFVLLGIIVKWLYK